MIEINEEAFEAENAVFEAKCATARSRGQRLFASIRPSSKYTHQAAPNETFPVVIVPGGEYVVRGGPGGQYRLKDVNLFAVFDDPAKLIQITFE